MLDSTYTRAVLPTNNPELLIENYLIVASSALLWYDFTLTFTTEYCRIWQREFSGATIVYFSMRYIAVVERVFLVFKALMRHSSQKVRCRGIAHADDALVFANYLAFAAFICLRVYGVCSSNWKPLLVVLPLTLIGPILSLASTTSLPNPALRPPDAYTFTIYRPVLHLIYIISRATTITAGVILVVLTWIKAGGIKKESLHTRMHTPLADLLLRDGTAYFISCPSPRN
ncbi:hypothetical protein GY45DRAFT_177149 [Cubamyces sp. BRFM 1775]|nr:hypothetical protein GY45DRAFT_177149 [Cubamyces sp. BRFM 1775]